MLKILWCVCAPFTDTGEDSGTFWGACLLLNALLTLSWLLMCKAANHDPETRDAVIMTIIRRNPGISVSSEPACL